MARFVFACGGGGLGSMSPNPNLVHEILDRTPPKPTILFLPTASGDAIEYIARFEQQVLEYGAIPRVLPLFRPSLWDRELVEYFDGVDFIWVGGGNTRNMLTLWDLWGVTPLIRKSYESGVPIGGVSAGAICWFEFGCTDSVGRKLGIMDCLGWIPGAATPHFDSEHDRRPMLSHFIESGLLHQEGIAFDEGVTGVFEDEKLVQIIREAGAGTAWIHRCEDRQAVIEPIPLP